MVMLVWTCEVCNTVNRTGNKCGNCGATKPHGNPHDDRLEGETAEDESAKDAAAGEAGEDAST